MSSHVKEFMVRVRADPIFREWLKDLRTKCPVVPAYRPGQSQEETQSVLENIKFESGRKEGFELALLHLTGEKQ